MAQNEPIKNFSAEDIQRYHAGELSLQERHMLEKAALDDPFLADTLEGYAYTQSPKNDLADLQAQLQKKIETQKDVPIKDIEAKHIGWWRIAALLLLLAGAGWVVYQLSKKDEQNIAFRIPKKQEQTNTAEADSITVMNSIKEDNLTTNDVAKAAPVMENKQEQKSLEKIQTTISRHVKKEQPMTADEKKAAKKELANKEKAEIAGLSDHNVLQESAPALANAPMQHTFRGQVVDIRNNPIPHASINADKIATLTDVNGNFIIKSSDTTLNATVNAVGFQPKRFEAKNTMKEQKVVLQNSGESLTEVVVTGIGTRNKNASQRARQASSISEPVNGWSHFNQYVAENRKSADSLGIDTVKGKVRLSFIINSQGRPQNIKVEQSLCAACDAEAVRLLKAGPDWKRMGSKRMFLTLDF